MLSFDNISHPIGANTVNIFEIMSLELKRKCDERQN